MKLTRWDDFKSKLFGATKTIKSVPHTVYKKTIGMDSANTLAHEVKKIDIKFKNGEAVPATEIEDLVKRYLEVGQTLMTAQSLPTLTRSQKQEAMRSYKAIVHLLAQIGHDIGDRTLFDLKDGKYTLRPEHRGNVNVN